MLNSGASLQHPSTSRRSDSVLPTTTPTFGDDPNSSSSSHSEPETAAHFVFSHTATASATMAANNNNDLLVFELTKDGGRRFFHMPVRGLYRYVLAAITSHHHQQNNEPSAPQPDARTRTTSAGGGAELQDPPLSPRRRTSSLAGPPRQRSTTTDATYTNTVTYRERLGGYLHPRDMRRLVTPFSATNEPALVMRRHVMVFHLDPLRAIITRDRLLVLVPTGADSILVQLEERVRKEEEHASVWTTHTSSTPDEDEDAPPSTAATTKKTVPRTSSRQQLRALLQRSSTSSMADSEDDNLEEAEDAYGADNDDDEQEEWNEMRANEWITVPFELQCAEAVLYVVSSILANDTEELQQSTQQYLQSIVGRSHSNSNHGMSHEHSTRQRQKPQQPRKQQSHQDPLTILRVVKDAVHLMTNRVHGFAQSLTRVLEDDEDMALMNLSRLLTHPERFIQPVSQTILDEESDEPELILESHLHTAQTVMNSLQVLQGQINNAKELVDQQQDATRNHLLLANMVISIVSLCVSVASLVGSLFGMNLPNPYENDASSFQTVTYSTVGATTALCGAILAVLWWSGTIPRTRVAATAASTSRMRM